ncbi:MAG: hypothetical protein F6K10_35290 [Moorea sp. SIO2B7]|nr:hypothetical protein [Moorena sp. SIO2B7]
MNNSNPSPICSDILLSLATAPMIVSLVAVESLLQGLIEIGEASEEVFRGDLLPILHPPQQSSEQ